MESLGHRAYSFRNVSAAKFPFTVVQVMIKGLREISQSFSLKTALQK